MFHRCIALIVLVALISSNFSKYFVYAGFKINQNYIAATLCENRVRPWMHCNGKCYLIKKLKQTEDNENKQAVKDNLSRLEVFFQQPFQLAWAAAAIVITVPPSFPAYTYLYSSRYIETIFRPPKQIA